MQVKTSQDVRDAVRELSENGETRCRFLRRHVEGEDTWIDIAKNREVWTDLVYELFFITLKTIKGMECASLMPIDLFFEAPCPMDSCNFMDDHPPHTRDVRWYNIRLYSTYVRWKRIMHYSTHEELMFVNLCL